MLSMIVVYATEMNMGEQSREFRAGFVDADGEMFCLTSAKVNIYSSIDRINLGNACFPFIFEMSSRFLYAATATAFAAARSFLRRKFSPLLIALAREL